MEGGGGWPLEMPREGEQVSRKDNRLELLLLWVGETQVPGRSGRMTRSVLAWAKEDSSVQAGEL